MNLGKHALEHSTLIVTCAPGDSLRRSFMRRYEQNYGCDLTLYEDRLPYRQSIPAMNKCKITASARFHTQAARIVYISERRRDRTGRLHHSSFKPNWICRDVVDVDVITPAVGAGTADADVNTTVFGVPKFA